MTNATGATTHGVRATGQTFHEAPGTGSPGWRPLVAVAALVVAAHVVLLQASPAQWGPGGEPDGAGGKIFSTRSIESLPAASTQAEAAPVAVPKVVKAAKTAKTAPKNLSNQALVQETRAQAAPEIIASAEPQTVAQAATQPPAAAPAASQTAESTTTQASAVAPIIGPKTTRVTAIRLPGSARLLYKVKGLSKNLNYQASSELAWTTSGDSYEVMMKVSAFLIGSRSMTSVGKITDSGLAPTRFADKFRNELAAHFEADKGKITFSANTPDAPWIEGAQDRVSVFLQLGGMLAANPQNYPPGSNVTFLTIGPREADTWTFIIEAEENLDLMGAQMPTLKLTRKPRKEFDQKVEIWFAPSLGYLPVRNLITQQNGDFIDQQLAEIVK
jgi:hypothetical protein